MIKNEIIDSSRRESLLIQFFLVIMIVFTGGLFLRPKVVDIFQMRKKINEEKKKLVKLTQKEAFLESLDEYELTSKTQFLLKILPTERDIVWPLATLKLLASELNLEVNSIQTDLNENKLDARLFSNGFSLGIIGDKENIKEFLERIKTTYPLMKIENLSISLQSESRFGANLKIKVFFLDLPEKIGSTEDPLPLVASAEEKIYQKVSGFSSPLKEKIIPSVPAGKENPFSF